jgi:aquaporin Z
LIIGLTLVIIHIVFIPVTGVSVNPARSLGPALFAGGNAPAQVWLFIVMPPIGGAIAGWLFRAKILTAVD